MAEEQTVEQQAEAIGWAPKERFRGDPERWVDAKTYLENGEKLLPIVRADNRALKEKVSTLESRLSDNEKALKDSAEAIEELKKHNSEATRSVAREEKKNLRRAIEDARREGDTDKVVELEDQLDEHNEAIEAAEQPKPKVEEPVKRETMTPLTPAFKAFKESNPWFGQDEIRTSVIVGVMQKRMKDPEFAALDQATKLEQAADETTRILGGGEERHVQRVEGANGDRPSDRNRKTYADLPADAKAACERSGSRVVGPNRAYKTVDEWRKKYVSDYDWE
jgi:hypothetical protein